MLVCYNVKLSNIEELKHFDLKCYHFDLTSKIDDNEFSLKLELIDSLDYFLEAFINDYKNVDVLDLLEINIKNLLLKIFCNDSVGVSLSGQYILKDNLTADDVNDKFFDFEKITDKNYKICLKNTNINLFPFIDVNNLKYVEEYVVEA